MAHLIEKLISYMKASAENRAQVLLLLAFFFIPAIGLGILYFIVTVFFLNK